MFLCVFFVSLSVIHLRTLFFCVVAMFEIAVFLCLISPGRVVQLVIEDRKEERNGRGGVSAIEEKGRRQIQSVS